jgi:hypothetical protein
MISHLATEDLPYTELVTGDWTMANELLGAVWPLDYPVGETGWKAVSYTDSRPAAGVLATNSLWWRYPSAGSNHNRGRANAVSDLLLCQDFLARPVNFPRHIDLTDEALVADALASNPGCVNCHVSLDPLASYLFGFTYADPDEPAEASVYHPEREQLWQGATGVAPGYFGEPGYTLRDLGQQIAGDNRFIECAVERVYEGLLQRDVTVEDADALTAHREAFLAGGLTLRSLFRSVLTDPRYRAAVDEHGGVPSKMAGPELLQTQIEDLTGYRFRVSGYDMLQTDLFGLRSLAGGADAYTGTGGASSPTPTMALVQQRVAEAAAYNAVVTESDQPADQRRLFPEGFPRPDEDNGAAVAQLQHLHLSLFGRRVATDGEEVTAGLALLDELLQIDGQAAVAWANLLSVLLRDPDILLY